MGSEDFAVFGQDVPSFFYWLGSGYPDRDNAGWHSPGFRTDDNALPLGAALLAESALLGLGPSNAAHGLRYKGGVRSPDPSVLGNVRRPLFCPFQFRGVSLGMRITAAVPTPGVLSMVSSPLHWACSR